MVSSDDTGELLLIFLLGIGITLSGLYAAGESLPGVGDDNTQVAVDENGDPVMCPNQPTIKKKRQKYNVYATGGFRLGDEELKAPNIRITTEDIAKRELAVFSIDSRVSGKLYTTVESPLQDVGYEGEIYFYDNVGDDVRYKMAFRDVASNWNCESYESARNNPDVNYRPQGARYKLKLVWFDKGQQEIVDSREQIVYVPYRR